MTIGDIIAKGFDRLPEYDYGKNWRDFCPELPDQIAKEIEDYLKPQLVSITENLCHIIEIKRKRQSHFPRETKGCYYGRIEDCCWLCVIRIFWAVIKGIRKGGVKG